MQIFYRSVYNIFQTFRRSKQDSKSSQLHHSATYSCVLITECFPAFTGECQTARKPNIYVMIVFFKNYYYFQNSFTELRIIYLFIPWSRLLREKPIV